MKIAGLQKLTLLDFPTRTACTVFTVGCNFRCPFCHNSDLLFKQQGELTEDEFFEFLRSRKGLLDGVCITGGEPLLQNDIIPFMQRIRSLGFLVKLDTNGSIYSKLEQIVNNKLCDYIAMDIKNIPQKYNLSCGGMVNVENVLKSVNLLINQTQIDYEFRTTVVKGLNEIEDFSQIASFIKGAKRYYLQAYKHSDKVLKQGYSAYSEEEMHTINDVLHKNGLECAKLRGV